MDQLNFKILLLIILFILFSFSKSFSAPDPPKCNIDEAFKISKYEVEVVFHGANPDIITYVCPHDVDNNGTLDLFIWYVYNNDGHYEIIKTFLPHEFMDVYEKSTRLREEAINQEMLENVKELQKRLAR